MEILGNWLRADEIVADERIFCLPNTQQAIELSILSKDKDWCTVMVSGPLPIHWLQL